MFFFVMLYKHTGTPVSECLVTHVTQGPGSFSDRKKVKMK